LQQGDPSTAPFGNGICGTSEPIPHLPFPSAIIIPLLFDSLEKAFLSLWGFDARNLEKVDAYVTQPGQMGVMVLHVFVYCFQDITGHRPHRFHGVTIHTFEN
jgi:hypothetical protein